MRPGRRRPYLRNAQTLKARAKHKAQTINNDQTMRGYGLAYDLMANAWVRDEDAYVRREIPAARAARRRG